MALDPSRVWAFMVDVDLEGEWTEESSVVGEVELWDGLQQYCGVPEDRILVIQHHEATVANLEDQLVEFLRRTGPLDTLVFYYGGHGESSSFCTAQGNWKHLDVIRIIDEYFRGQAALLLVDCCYSGNFGRALFCRQQQQSQSQQQNNPQRITSYACLMSTLPDTLAGEEYTFTDYLICAMRGDAEVDLRDDGRITLDEVVSHLADRVAQKKGDVLTAYCTKGFPPDTDFFTGRVVSSPEKASKTAKFAYQTNGVSTSTEIVSMPKESPFQPPDLSQWEDYDVWSNTLGGNFGTRVVCKWHGGAPSGVQLSSSHNFIMPVWMPGIVISTAEEAENDRGSDSVVMVSLEMEDPITSQKWRTTAPRHCLLPFDYFRRPSAGLEYDGPCVQFLVRMAKHLRFLSFVLPPGTHVKVLWDEEEGMYDATVVSPVDIPWDDMSYEQFLRYYGEIGPFVPVRWDEEETYSIVPLGRCLRTSDHAFTVKDDLVEMVAREAARDSWKNVSTPRQALLQSMESAGKTLHQAPSLRQHLHCYWAEDREWGSARAVELQEVTLEALAGHVSYQQIGNYYAVRWDDDGIVSILPGAYVKNREQDRAKSCCGIS